MVWKMKFIVLISNPTTSWDQSMNIIEIEIFQLNLQPLEKEAISITIRLSSFWLKILYLQVLLVLSFFQIT